MRSNIHPTMAAALAPFIQQVHSPFKATWAGAFHDAIEHGMTESEAEDFADATALAAAETMVALQERDVAATRSCQTCQHHSAALVPCGDCRGNDRWEARQ